MKTLYFEGAGYEKAEAATISGVGNCRIRTACHLDNGSSVYIEIIGSVVNKWTAPRAQHLKVAGWVTDCFSIRGNIDDGDYSLVKHSRESLFEFNRDNILCFVNSLGCSFDSVEVLPALAGYRVFKDSYQSCHRIDRYNFGDEFRPNRELTAQRIAIRDRIQERDKAAGIKHPCFSLWIDESDPDLLQYQNDRTGERSTIRTSNPESIQAIFER